MVRFALIVGFLVAFAGPAWADFQAGQEAYERGDYATVLEEWRPLAEQGDAEAQFELGQLYQFAQGVPLDYVEAVKWFGRAAEQGHAAAQLSLALMYRRGTGVPDDAQAVRWFLLAAEQGHWFATAMLETLYGKGVAAYRRDDFGGAVRIFQPLADQGYASAQFNLGFMYANGQGVPQDYVQSHKWFNLAASRYLASEKERRDIAIKSGDLVAAEMTPAQTAEAQKLAHEWRPK